MNASLQGIRSDDRRVQTAPPRPGWLASVVLGALLLFVYLINGRELGTDDTFSATLLPLNILRGEGIYLERKYYPKDMKPSEIPYTWIWSRRHLVPLYPVAPALVALPLVAPQIAVRDFVRPGWDRHPLLAASESRVMVKRSMALLVALTGVILYRVLLLLELRRAALPAVLAACLGSDLWTVASQAAWQHGPAALSLIAAIALLLPQPMSRRRLTLAGLAATSLVACRLMDIVFAVAIVAWLVWNDRRALRWFLPAPILGGLGLLTYNFWFFGSIVGGQAQIEQRHTAFHGVTGVWSSNLLDGFYGTLFCPNRGLLVFSPWVAVALATLAVPSVRRKLAAHSLISMLIASLIPYLLILSKYSVWWGGHCFGPRYWTDAIPLFAILLAIGLEGALARPRALALISAITIVFSIAVQIVGAFCFPSTWNSRPANVDLNHNRLWDWRDTELSRCLIESFRPPGR
jgi:hypothetical protein